EKTRDGQRATRGERGPPALPRREEQTRDRESLGQLVQQDRDKDEQPQRVAPPESACDRYAVHERVQNQSRERREAHELRDVVNLLAEVKVRRQRVLREMNQQVPDQDHKRRRLAVDLDRIG